LTKHFGYTPTAARQLGVSAPDLRRLTWAKPDLLEEALLQCQVFADRAFSVMIKALDTGRAAVETRVANFICGMVGLIRRRVDVATRWSAFRPHAAAVSSPIGRTSGIRTTTTSRRLGTFANGR
jgi:hypothetical protein